MQIEREIILHRRRKKPQQGNNALEKQETCESETLKFTRLHYFSAMHDIQPAVTTPPVMHSPRILVGNLM